MAERTQNVIGMSEMPARKSRRARTLSYVVLVAGGLLALLPFLWMVSWSLMANIEVTVGRVFPAQVLWENYGIAWDKANFSQFMWNSSRITAITVCGLLLFCIPAAYAFARMRFWGRNVLFALMLATLMIPDIVTLIPNFLTVVWINRLSQSLVGPAGAWMNSWPALTVPFMASAFTIFLLRQFFTQIPDELWDAARIDGAGHLLFLLRVVVPLSQASHHDRRNLFLHRLLERVVVAAAGDPDGRMAPGRLRPDQVCAGRRRRRVPPADGGLGHYDRAHPRAVLLHAEAVHGGDCHNWHQRLE